MKIIFILLSLLALPLAAGDRSQADLTELQREKLLRIQAQRAAIEAEIEAEYASRMAPLNAEQNEILVPLCESIGVAPEEAAEQCKVDVAPTKEHKFGVVRRSDPAASADPPAAEEGEFGHLENRSGGPGGTE